MLCVAWTPFGMMSEVEIDEREEEEADVCQFRSLDERLAYMSGRCATHHHVQIHALAPTIDSARRGGHRKGVRPWSVDPA